MYKKIEKLECRIFITRHFITKFEQNGRKYFNENDWKKAVFSEHMSFR